MSSSKSKLQASFELELYKCTTSEMVTQAKKDIWEGILELQTDDIIGLGGRYGFLSVKFLSKLNRVDSDHFPPFASYKHARDRNIARLSKADMAAVTMTHDFHHQFFTTYNSPASQEIMRNYFANGDYFGAINTNIGWYLSNPQRRVNTGTEIADIPLIALSHNGATMEVNSLVPGMRNWLHEGIIAGLEIHFINGLITREQKMDLERIHGLSPVGGGSERRQAARELIFEDTEEYRERMRE